MSEVKSDKQKSAAVPDGEFGQLTQAEKWAWFTGYLAEGRQQIADGTSICLRSDEEIANLFNLIRREAQNRAGLYSPPLKSR